MIAPEIPEDVPHELSLANLELRQAAVELDQASKRYHAAIVGRMGVMAKLRGESL